MFKLTNDPRRRRQQAGNRAALCYDEGCCTKDRGGSLGRIFPRSIDT
jgi:hypothetical protein